MMISLTSKAYEAISHGISDSFYWDHKILPLGDVPSGFTGPVFFRYQIRMAGTANGYFPEVYAGIEAYGGLTYSNHSSPLSEETILNGTALQGQILRAMLRASILIFTADMKTGQGQIVVDPYIYIDPTWEYASYFGVYSQPGPNDGDVWQLVNRDWMTPVPIPPTVWLLGRGLLGLVGLRRKFTNYLEK